MSHDKRGSGGNGGGGGQGKDGGAKKPDPGSPFSVLADLKKKMADDEAKAKEATIAKSAPKPGARPAPSRPTSSRAAPTGPAVRGTGDQDDALTFHRLMSGVTPLDARATRIPKSQRSVENDPDRPLARRKEAESAAQAEADAVHAHLRALVEGGARFEVEDDGRKVEGRRTELPMDAVRRLRRGLVPIDARLDLHGLHAEDARASIGRFLAEKRARGERCVLLVHGKGEHSPAGIGILRGEMAAWLSQGSASEHVSAFVTAREEDGGEGALYVLLRR